MALHECFFFHFSFPQVFCLNYNLRFGYMNNELQLRFGFSFFLKSLWWIRNFNFNTNINSKFVFIHFLHFDRFCLLIDHRSHRLSYFYEIMCCCFPIENDWNLKIKNRKILLKTKQNTQLIKNPEFSFFLFSSFLEQLHHDWQIEINIHTLPTSIPWLMTNLTTPQQTANQNKILNAN